MNSALTALSGLVFFSAFLPYIIAICKKDNPAKPSKATWLIWISLDVLTLVGMIATKTVNGQIIGAIVGAGVVLILAFFKGESGWTWLEKSCLTGAIIGITLWVIFQNPLLAILASQITLFLGSIPTFVSAWKDPSRENKLAWTLWWSSCLLAIIAIPQWTLANSAQPINFLIIESIMMYILFCRKNQKEHTPL